MKAEIQTEIDPNQTHRGAETSENSVPLVLIKDQIDSNAIEVNCAQA